MAAATSSATSTLTTHWPGRWPMARVRSSSPWTTHWLPSTSIRPKSAPASLPAWTVAHADELGVDPRRLAVAGDSAGGNLAAVVALRARESGGPQIAMQLLIYPDLDFRRENRSITELAGRYGNVTREAQAWFMDHYLVDSVQRLDPRVFQLLEPDLAELPPAYIVTAEYDALRDEGEQYGARLAEAGVPVTVRRYDGMIHEFLRHPFDDAEVAIAEMTEALARTLGASITA